MSETQKHTKPNVPNLRFPGFEGEWKEKTIGDILSIGNGSDYKHLSSGPIPVFGTGGKLAEVEGYIYEGETVCIGRKGTINKPFYYNGRFWTVDTLFYTYGFSQVLPKFVLYLFERINWIKYNEASGVPSLSKKTIEAILVNVPTQEEQIIISDCLSLIDERISIQNKVIERYESLIKALAYEIIGQKVPNTLLSDLVSCASSSLKESDLSETGDIPTYGAAGLSGYTEQCLSEKESILITKDGSGVGSMRYVSGRHSFVGTLNSLTPKEGIYLPYVYYALLNVNFEAYRTGQAIPHIYFKDYGKEGIYCPAYEDQVKLAKGLELIDVRIEHEKAVLQGLQTIKVYMLSALFI